MDQGGLLKTGSGTVIVHGNLKMYGGQLDAGSGNITVDTDLDQTGGLLNVGNAKINIKGTYALSSAGKPAPGATGSYATEYYYTTGSGILQMKDSGGRVLVGGNFITSSDYSHDSRLTAGVLEVKGDFYQCGWGNGCNLFNGTADLFLKEAAKSKGSDRRNFKASGLHKVLLSGTRLQKVGMAITGPNDSQFAVLEITNPIEVKFVTNVTVSTLFNHNGKKFTLSDAANSRFPDYDGDGQKDNVDSTPCPVVQDQNTIDTNGSVIKTPVTDRRTNPRLTPGSKFPKLPRLPGIPEDKTPAGGNNILKPPVRPGPAGDRPIRTGDPVTTVVYLSPSNLTAVPGDKSITLEWYAPDSSQVKGYKLYRLDEAGNYSAVDDLIIEDCIYLDENLLFTNSYSYYCKAVYKDGHESGPSNTVSAIPFCMDFPGFSATIEDSKVLFMMPEINKTGVVGFNIYRGTLPGDQESDAINPEPVGEGEYTDASAKPGWTYYYVGTYVYEDGSESEISPELAVIVPELDIPLVSTKIVLVLTLGKSTLSLNGTDMEIEKGKSIKPIAVKGQFMVPWKVFEAFGTKITENKMQKSVTLELGGNKIVLWQGKNKITINGKSKIISAIPQLRGGRLMVPIQTIAEGLGCKYSYDSKTKTVTLSRE